MASANNYPTADFSLPSGISLDKFSIKHDTARNALTCSLPVLLQSVYELANPVDDQFAKTPGGKKYSVGLAIPKTALPMLKELKAKSDALMAADGVKGPYPSAIKDGGSQDGNGLGAVQGASAPQTDHRLATFLAGQAGPPFCGLGRRFPFDFIKKNRT